MPFLANGSSRIGGEFGASQTTNFPQEAIHNFGVAEGARGEPSSHPITPQKRNCKETFGAGLVPLSPVTVAPSLETSSRTTVTSRRRSYQYYLARDALARVADCGREELDLSLVRVHLGNWDWCYHAGRFVMLSKEDEYLFIRAINRFSEDYKRRLKKKLWLLRSVKWNLKLELTLDPKMFMRLFDEFMFVDPAWARLRAWLYKRYGHFEFLKVLEVQKSGRPHLHILLSGISHIPHEGLYAVWQKYGGGYVWVRRIEGRIDAVSYVLKYVNKTILGEDKTYAALLFASNKRMFSMSQGLRDIISSTHTTEKKGYMFGGMVEEAYVREFCSAENVVYNDFVKASVSTEILYRYPQLFDVIDTA